MRADHFKLDGRRALIDHAQCSGRRVREVQHAPHDIGTTIGDTVLHILAMPKFRTRTMLPKGSLRCTAVLAVISKTSPLAANFP